MIQQPEASASAAASSAPITSFEAQEGAPIPEQHSGVKLLVSAYIAFWLVVMIFVQLTWLRQRRLASRVGELERAIDKATGEAEERMMRTVVKDRPKSERD